MVAAPSMPPTNTLECFQFRGRGRRRCRLLDEGGGEGVIVSVSVRKVRVCVVIRDKKVTRNMGVGIISKFGEGATAFRPVRQRLVIRHSSNSSRQAEGR